MVQNAILSLARELSPNGVEAKLSVEQALPSAVQISSETIRVGIAYLGCTRRLNGMACGNSCWSLEVNGQ